MLPVTVNNNLIENHRLYCKCGSTLNDVSKRDYRGKNYFDNTIKCLDTDSYENKLAANEKRDKRPTVDAVIGISDIKNGLKTCNRLFLVELRLGYKTEETLDFDNMYRKVTNTRGFFYNDRIENEVAFIFSETIIQKTKNAFERRKRASKKFKDFTIYTVNSFNNTVK